MTELLELPVLDGSRHVVYPLLELPVPGERVRSSRLGAEGAGAYREWLVATEQGRYLSVMAVFGAAGLRWGPDSSGELVDLDALAEFMEAWFPLVMGPHMVVSRTLPWNPPVCLVTSEAGLRLQASICHDIAFALSAHIRRAIPGLNWVVWSGRGTRGTVRNATITSSTKKSPVDFSMQFLMGCLSRYAEGTDPSSGARASVFSPAEWRARLRQFVTDSVEAPGPVKPALPVPALHIGERFGPLLDEGGQQEASPEIVTALATYRELGFFANSGSREPHRLAALLQATWEVSEGAPMPTLSPDLDAALLELDYERTVGFDVEADVFGGNRVYEAIALAVATTAGADGPGLEVHEEWPGDGTVVLTISAPSGPHRGQFDYVGDYVHPGILELLNAAFATSESRLWYYDPGAQYVLVVRASEKERQALRQRRGVALEPVAPAWWLEVVADD